MEIEMSLLMSSSPIGDLITSTTARTLEADWGPVAQPCRMDSAVANKPIRRQAIEKRNWLDRACASISRRFSAARLVAGRDA